MNIETLSDILLNSPNQEFINALTLGQFRISKNNYVNGLVPLTAVLSNNFILSQLINEELSSSEIEYILNSFPPSLLTVRLTDVLLFNNYN
jgi:hypothetical protein